LVLGRAPESDLVIDSPLASFKHARIENRGTEWTLVDLGSRNGTRVDGALVSEPTRLHDGNVISVGGQDVRVEIHAPPSTPPPEPPARPRSRSGSQAQTSLRRMLSLPAAGKVTLGRDPDCDFPLPNPNVSWRHARISVSGDEVRITDLGSRNGTLVDGRFVRTANLRASAEITIGPFVLGLDRRRLSSRTPPRRVLEALRLEYLVDQAPAEVDLEINAGELVAVLGESGAGKTTLLRTVTADVEPVSGDLRLAGVPLAQRRWDVGYVPQHDIVHPSLTIEESLRCAARLRLPPDQRRGELDARLRSVMAELAIEKHKHKRNDCISGGQRKRVSVATELLGDPRLLVLDEPTTGLDPLWEERMMRVLRDRAAGDSAVLFVTHTTSWLDECDRLWVMARGGTLAFDGPPREALEHFGVDAYKDIYASLEARSSGTASASAPPGPRPQSTAARSMSRGAVLGTGRALVARDVRLYLSDRRNAMSRIAGALLGGALLAGIFGGDVFEARPGHVTKSAQLLFAALFVVTMFATTSAARDLVRERPVFQRERALGVPVSVYAASKLLVLGTVAVIEAGLLAATVLTLAPLHAPPEAYAHVGAAFALTALVGVAAGLALSAFARTEAQAATSLGFVFVPQLLLAGAIVSLEQMGAARHLADAVPIRWAYAHAGSAIDINVRAVSDRGFRDFYGPEFFDLAPGFAALALLGFAIALACVLLARLRFEP
jgi:ABC-type multidrug transport system ATPase subunit